MVLVALSTTCSAAENNPKSLQEQIKVMSQELETGDSSKIKSFILNYSDFDFASGIKSDKKLDRIANNFMKRKQKILKSALLILDTIEPAMSKRRDRYTFKLPKDKIEGLSKSRIVFTYSKKSNEVLRL